MQDQNGKPVPHDLVMLESDWLDWLSQGELEAIDNLDWYELVYDNTARNSVVWASRDKLHKAIHVGFDSYGPEDSLGTDYIEILYIDRVLHRFNPIDGFYHA